jgi:S-layer protein (TIGR01567 family)
MLLMLSIISIVLAAPTGNTVPGIGNISVDKTTITDTSATITFTVNQSDANTIVSYGTTSLDQQSKWDNGTGLTRVITLSGLDQNTKYSYKIYAYNGSDPSKSRTSSTRSFTTTGNATPPLPTSPDISTINIVDTTSSTANISFDVSQSDANTIIRYGTTSANLDRQSNWNNNSGATRRITLSGLLNDTEYNFSIYAYNGSNQSYYKNSTVGTFITKNVSSNGTGSGTSNVPDINTINIVNTTSSTANISFNVNQSDAHTRIYYGIDQSLGTWSDWNNNSGTTRTITLPGLLNDTEYNFSIYAYNGSNQSYYKNSTIGTFITKSSNGTSNGTGNSNIPVITGTTPEQTKHTTENVPINFTISFDQVVNVTWRLNNTIVQENNSVTSSYYLNNTLPVGTWNITATGENDNGIKKSYSWTLTVDPEPSHAGNRIWDGTKGMSTTYTWNSYSFPGFYYDLNSNTSTEELTITNIQSTIAKGNIVYKTSPVEVNFGHPNFGKYQVIGFMADKYFAGYTANGTISNNKVISTIGSGQLQKILLDDDDKRSVYEGSTLTLGEGYVLKMKQVDVGAGPGQIWVSLLKDGREVDNAVVAGGGDYIYSKRVGSIQDLPIIAIHFDNIFRGTETNAAFIKGIFQISESINSIKSGDDYSIMKISGVDSNEITMDNKESISLASGSKIDLMGNLKIIVADSSTLRFALSVARTGEFEVRGTVYPVVDQWTPMNFGLNINTATGNTNIGFYYDIDEDIGTEKLKLESISGSSIPEGKLLYSTSPQEVSFGYSNFGKYQVIGFMADKYFAGYTGNTKPPSPSASIGTVSVISQGQLHKILIDDEDKRTISVGSTLTLKDGYVLKAKDIDLSARTMLLALLKDGSEVDETPLSAGQTYVYEKKVGSVDNLPIIIVRFDSVFSGTEVQAAFIKGVFQISETVTSVKTGDTYGAMEISDIGTNGINMSSHGSISLSTGSTIDLMGNIKLKVADSSDVRFYPYVLVTQDMVANQLTISAPNKATAGDTITINVTAGGVPIEGASISIDPEIGSIGNNTNNGGIVNYTLPIKSKGIYNITAAKLGYENANRTIEIEKYIAGRLSINVPLIIDQFDMVPIRITSNNTNISGVTVIYDNNTVGTTDSNGILNYTFGSNGTHTISASKDYYISSSRDANIREPYSEFKSQNINITPSNVYTGEDIMIMSNITNIGTKGDTKIVDLVINGSVVNNQSVTIGKKETKEINFTYKVSLPQGNYTVEIMGQKGLVEVKKGTSDIILIAAIITIIGVMIIYVITSKNNKITDLIKKLKNR